MKDLEKYFDKEITLSGFAEKIRNLQWVQFIVLRNKTDRLQITIEKSDENNKEMIEIVDKLTCESTIKVTGILKKTNSLQTLSVLQIQGLKMMEFFIFLQLLSLKNVQNFKIAFLKK